MLLGNQIADIPIVAASTDPCMSCTNRVAVIENNDTQVFTKEELHRLSIEKTRRLQQ
jgi:membrane-bound hydrogenase subunit alpha